LERTDIERTDIDANGRRVVIDGATVFTRDP
jgi:hypothetical protein